MCQTQHVPKSETLTIFSLKQQCPEHSGMFGTEQLESCHRGRDIGIWPRTARVVPRSRTADEGASWDLAYDSQGRCLGRSDEGHGRSCVLRQQAWFPSSLQPASQLLIQLAPCGSDSCSSGAHRAGRRTLHDVADKNIDFGEVKWSVYCHPATEWHSWKWNPKLLFLRHCI